MLQFTQTYADERDLSPQSRQTYLAHAHAFIRAMGPHTIQDVTVDAVNRYLRHLNDGEHSDSYRKSARAHLAAIARYAASLGLVEWDDNRLAKVRVRDYQPRAFSLAEVRMLVESARQLCGEYPGGIKRAAWWNAYLRLAWDSGLAPCDVVILHRRSIAEGGKPTYTVRSKTGKRVWFRVQPSTLAAIDATFPPTRSEAVPRLVTWEAIRKTFKHDLDTCHHAAW